MKKYKILCVDDEEDVLAIYVEFFLDSEYEIVTLLSCYKALEYIKEHGQSIIYIFSDYKMEEMNGLEFRKLTNDLGHEIPFSLVTGYYDLEMSKSAMALSISSFVEKPFSDSILKELVDGLGEKRRLLLDEELEMVISFIEESYPMLLEIEDLIISLETDPDNSALLNTYFRLLHTIKGTASCVGLKSIAKFTHKYEDLVVKLQGKKLILTPEVANALLKGLDQLKFMYAETKNGRLEADVDDIIGIFDLGNFKNSNVEVLKNEVSISRNPPVDSLTEIAEDKIGVSVNILNKFMELSGQLTVIRNTLIKSAVILGQRYYGDNEIEIMIDSLGEMHKVSSVLQTDISEMRKISLEVIYKPLRRVIRDSSKSLNKDIEFQVEGESLRVDTAIGKALSNSLVHMIRNSIDHGIELPEQRVSLGKKNIGIIRLKSVQDGENIIVKLSDDGNGLSLGRIKKKALEKNLFSEEQLRQMPDQKIFLLIFDSGFSTAQKVSDISGRGVGMDMVKNSIESIGGKILIDSVEGQGTCFTLTLPIPRSVLIIKSLMIKSNEAIFSIPLDEVAEVVRIEDFRDSKIIHNVGQRLLLRHHNELLPLLDLNQVLCGIKQYDQFEVMSIVIVRAEGFKYGIIVDEIMDIEEIVVKKMSKHFKNANCFMGVTFLGHSTLALILNLVSIAEKANVECLNEFDAPKAAVVAHIELQEFMQFNLKNSNNYALPLHVVSRLEEVAIKEIEFCGAIPLVRYRGAVMPLLYIERQLELCPMDKNLIDQYSELLKIIVVNVHDKQFGIIVDQILDIGTTSELLNTRNVDREGFIGTIIIDHKIVTIVDVYFLVDNFINFEKAVIEKTPSAACLDMHGKDAKVA